MGLMTTVIVTLPLGVLPPSMGKQPRGHGDVWRSTSKPGHCHHMLVNGVWLLISFYCQRTFLYDGWGQRSPTSYGKLFPSIQTHTHTCTHTYTHAPAHAHTHTHTHIHTHCVHLGLPASSQPLQQGYTLPTPQRPTPWTGRVLYSQ